MYVNRESGLLRNFLFVADSDDRPWDQVRASGSRWWLDRRRQRGGVLIVNTVDDVHRPASQRRNSSGPYGKERSRRDTVSRGSVTSTTSVRRTRLLSTRRRHPWTAVRQLVRPPTPADTHVSAATHTDGRTSARPAQQLVCHTPSGSHSDNFNVD